MTASDDEPVANAEAADVTTVLLAIAGSEAAFDALMRRYQGRIRILLRRACGNATLADDLTQVAFAKAWLQLGTLRDATRFFPWLRRIALNAAIDHARAHNLHADILSEGDAAVDSGADLRLDLDAALQQLTFAQRACVLLAYGEGMSHQEIGTALRMPVGTVKSHIARAIPYLRRTLADWR